MTAAGRAQAAAAAGVVAPAVAAFNRSLARTRRAGPGECAVLASGLHGCFGVLATVVNSTGYAASGRWRGEFLPGQASDPAWLYSTAFAAAQRLQDAANLTIAIRAARSDGTLAELPILRAEHIMWSACHDLSELIVEHRRAGARPQVPDYAAVLAGLHAACGPLASAAEATAPRLGGIQPDPFSIWCEEFDGDLPAAFRSAARCCREAARILLSVRDCAAADVRAWRSRSRVRPGGG